MPPDSPLPAQEQQPEQIILLADHQIALPEGVTVTEWGLEKVRWQNPRIRAILGCIRLLGTVLESNYAILHCSPDRLREIWRKVRTVADLIRNQIAPLLDQPSCIPQLEQARQSVQFSFEMLSRDVLADLDGFPKKIPADQLIDVRKLLCVSIGQVHAFLQDTFGEFMANDPRSLHDADYFLSKRFPQDIEEAEWLHVTVEKLRDFLDQLESERAQHLAPMIRQLERDQRLPDRHSWQQVWSLLDQLIRELTPKLRETLALRGIRFYEMETLDRYTIDIPNQCQVLIALDEAGAETVESLVAAGHQPTDRDLAQCHAIFSRRIVRLMQQLDTSLRDLVAFVPVWLQGIERRRALLLRRSAESHERSQES